jgi:hypothetical protein
MDGRRNTRYHGLVLFYEIMVCIGSRIVLSALRFRQS